jgi:hypothetical protein
MRLLRYLGESLSFGLGYACSWFWLIAVMLLHLALVLMKIEFVHTGRSDLEGFDVACLTFHSFPLSFLVEWPPG